MTHPHIGPKLIGIFATISALILLFSCGSSSDDWTETKPMQPHEIERIYQQYERDTLMLGQEKYYWILEPDSESEVLERLLHTPGGVNSMYSESKFSFLHRASTSVNNPDISADTLIKHGADVSIISDNGSTPLHMAAMFCNVPVAKLLLENGADVHAVNRYGFTPLMEACQSSNNPGDRQEMVELLIEWGADPKTYTPFEIWEQSTWPRTPYDGLKEQWEKHQDAEAKQLMDQWEAPPRLPQ